MNLSFRPGGRLAMVAIAVLALLLVAAGSEAATPPPLPEQATQTAVERTGQQDAPQPRVTVAVVEAGFTNPYHEWFNAGGPVYGDDAPSAVTDEVLAEFGIDEQHIIELTRTGDFESDFAADEDQFDAINKGEPYWIKGTNIIGISFKETDGERLRPDGDASAHPVGTTGAVAAANPEAVIVSVEGDYNSLLAVDQSAGPPEAEEWAFTHPAVDLVSTSYGPLGGTPALQNLSNSYTGVVDNGKLHFGAAANAPTPAPVDETGGPWWTIGIGGFEEGSSEGRQVLSGSVTDFVGDFIQTLPYCRACESGTESVAGTSFATPRSAGTFSKVLLEVRRAAEHVGGITAGGDGPPVMVDGNGYSLTNWELRRALEEGAYYPSTGDYDPEEGVFDLAGVPVADAAPWAQTGWGALTPDPEHEVVDQTLAHLGVGGEPTRIKSAQACQFMTGVHEARHAYWDNVAVFAESAGTSADPYVHCGG